MKPGYYIAESGTLQVWYPVGYFDSGLQRVEFVFNDNWTLLDYAETTCSSFKKWRDLTFLGDL